MSDKQKTKTPVKLSRREFLKDAGIMVGTTAVGSAFLLGACTEEKEITKTVTKTTTAPGTTNTVTTTAPGGTVTRTETSSKFICPVCSQEFTTLDALKTHYEVEHGAATAVSLNVIKFTVNGQLYELQVEPNWDLQYLLHDVLGIIDVKTFCYRGACGSCTVILDGRPILSCMKLALHCDGAVIETASGIADSVPELADAYIMNHAMQCGYCTPGFLTTVKALLDRNDNPSADDIVEAIAGNMCRCGTYPAHIKATLEAAAALRGGA